MNDNFINSLTLDEVETIENLTGTPMDEILSKGSLKGKALKAIYWVAKKRETPDLKMDQVGQITFADALALFEGEADPKG